MKKLIITAILPIFLFSCGFQVIYREKESGISYEKELSAMKIQKSPGRLSQELRNNLYDLLNPDSLETDPKYYIVLKEEESIGSTFLTSTGASGRNKITINVQYTLFDLKTGKKIANGVTTANDNYDVQTNRYGTYTAEQYTKSNLTKVLAQNLRNLLVNNIIEMKKLAQP